MVWARTAATTNFRKLWGRIEKDIPAATTLNLKITNSFPSNYQFN